MDSEMLIDNQFNIGNIMKFIYQIIRPFVFIFAAILIFGCEDQIVNECSEKELDGGTRLSTLSSIQKEIFSVNCAKSGCHAGSNPQANLNLEDGNSYTNLVDVDALLYPGQKRIIPFDSKNSLLIKILKGEVSPQMPISSDPLNDAVIDSIALWIDKGALDN